MELIVLLLIVAVGGIWYINNQMRKSAERRAAESQKTEEVPYKVEPAPVAEPAKCGCGRSPTGLCVGLHKLTVEEWLIHPDNVNKVAAEPAAEAKPKRVKKPAKSKAVVTKAAKKPRASKAAKTARS